MNNRWEGIKRPYSYDDVDRLRDGWGEQYTVALKSAEKLWKLLTVEPFINALGALTGNQAIQT